MDIITIDKTNYSTGTAVNNLDSVLWVERYLEPGEFKLICEPTPALRSQLALGTFISHVDTPEVMVVENHEIRETFGSSPKLEVTGRSLDCFLEKRIISNGTAPFDTPFNQTTGNAIEFSIGSSQPVDQAVYLLIAFFIGGTLTSSNVVSNVAIIKDTTIPTVTATENSYKRGTNLHKAVFELLQGSKLGIRFERPMRDKAGVPIHHYDSVADPNALKMALYLHSGVDRSATVSFFYDSEDIKDARYFWSNKNELNLLEACTYYSRTLTYRGGVTTTAWNNKTGYVDVTEINTKWAGNPTEFVRQASVLNQRTAEAFGASDVVTLMEATISPNAKYSYRDHYIVGDLVYVVGNYGVSSKMRVIENVEAWDETGYTSYPTLGPV